VVSECNAIYHPKLLGNEYRMIPFDNIHGNLNTVELHLSGLYSSGSG